MTKKAFETRAEQELAEYGTFRATQTIYVDGVRAYVKGHPVPVSNVQKFRYDEMGLVERVDGAEKAEPQAATVAPDAEKK